MTTLYKRAGAGNWSAAGSWSLTSGGGATGTVPTAADDVIVNAASGNLTIDGTSGAPSLCRSITCTGFTGSLIQGSTNHLTIGDASGGSMTLAATMTYTPNTNSNTNFVSTTTGNTITFAGRVVQNNLNFNGVGGEWIFQDNNTQLPAINLLNGSLNLNGKTLTLFTFLSNVQTTRTLTLGAATISVGGGTDCWVIDPTNLTFSQSGSSITLTGTAPRFTGGGLTYNSLTISGQGFARINNANTFATLTRTGSAAKTDQLILAADQVVTGTCTITGNSTINRVLVLSDTLGTPRSLSAGTFTFSRVDLRDITKAGAGSGNISAITGLSGDCGGNTGWTFTSPATSYWVPSGGTSTGSMSAVTRWASSSGGTAGTGRAPLPQDTSVFNASSIDAGSRTITQDMVRVGSINWTGATNTPAWTKSVNFECYGSITMINGMTQSGTANLSFFGRGSNTLTCGSTTLTNQIFINLDTGTLQQQDNYTGSLAFNLVSGTYDGNGKTIFPANTVITGGTLDLNGGAFSTASYSQSAGSVIFDGAVTLTSTISQTGGTLNFTGGSLSSSSTVTVSAGTFTLGAGPTTATNISVSSSNTRTINLGSGIITLTGTGNVWVLNSATGLTLNEGTAKFDITNTSATAKTFASTGGTGQTYYDIRIRGASGAGTVTLTGSNDFHEMTLDPNANVRFTAGTTTTLTVPPAWVGTAGNVITIASATAAAHDIVCASGTAVCDYLDLTNSHASGGAAFYAGSHANDNGGNTGWNFSDPGAGTTPGAGAAAGSSTVGGVGASEAEAAGAASGTGTPTGAGASEAAAAGAASGSTTVSGAGKAVISGAGASSGSATVDGDGESTASGAGAADGDGDATGTGASEAAAAGSASGSATPTGAGASEAEAAGSASGGTTVLGSGGGIVSGAGSSSGTSAVSGIGKSTGSGAGDADGEGDATGTGASESAAAGAASGSTTVSGAGASAASGAGAADGDGDATGTGASEAAAAGSSTGISDPQGAGASTAAAAGSSSGGSDVEGISETGSTIISAVGNAAGTSTAYAISKSNVIPIRGGGGGRKRSDAIFLGRDPDKMRETIEAERRRQQNNALMVLLQ